MAYCTQSDLESRYSAADLVELTDRTASGAIDAQLVADAIERADADIDGALADAGYSPPLPDWSRTRNVAEALAYGYLFGQRRMTEQAQTDFDAAQKWLERVSQGRVRPPAALAEAGSTPAGGAPDYAAAPSVFGTDIDDY